MTTTEIAAEAVRIERNGDGHRLTTVVDLPADRERVFAFFADAFRLEAITPPWLRFRVTTPRPIDMRTGARIDYRLRLHGWPVRWRSEIDDWTPPVRFVDRQLVGPYRRWNHRHDFEPLPDGGTRVTDTVDYSVPGGPLVHRLFVRRDLIRIFEFRRRTLLDLFPVPSPLS